MTAVEYLDLAQIAELAGVGVPSMRTYRKRSVANRAEANVRPGDLPPEDIRLGGMPGWHRDTVTAWLASRPRANVTVSPAVTEALEAVRAARRARDEAVARHVVEQSTASLHARTAAREALAEAIERAHHVRSAQ